MEETITVNKADLQELYEAMEARHRDAVKAGETEVVDITNMAIKQLDKILAPTEP